MGLPLLPDLYPGVAISRGGGSLFVTDGQVIILTDSGGKIRKKINTHYLARFMSCSPDGRYLITCDMDSGVIRVYDGQDLTLSHQRFAIDLVAEASQIQLLADLPSDTAAINTLTISNDGVIAFSMTGIVCVTNITHMDELPRPQSLL